MFPNYNIKLLFITSQHFIHHLHSFVTSALISKGHNQTLNEIKYQTIRLNPKKKKKLV